MFVCFLHSYQILVVRKRLDCIKLATSKLFTFSINLFRRSKCLSVSFWGGEMWNCKIIKRNKLNIFSGTNFPIKMQNHPLSSWSKFKTCFLIHCKWRGHFFFFFLGLNHFFQKKLSEFSFIREIFELNWQIPVQKK